MTSSTRLRAILTLVALAAAALAPRIAAADPTKCAQAVAGASAVFEQTKMALLAKCEGAKLAGKLPAATVCRADAKAAAGIAKAMDKQASAIDKACGGQDKACGGDPTGEVSPGAIGFGASCPDLDGGGCSNAIADCGGVATCIACIGEKAVDDALALAVGNLVPGPNTKAVTACQKAIAKATGAFVVAKSKALQKCWAARLAGKHANPCPDPGDGKAGPSIAKAMTKLHDAVCKACGGPDKACGTGDDLTPAEIGFAPTCPAVRVPGGGADCGAIGTVGSLDALEQCLACVSEHEVDCATDAALPSVVAYPGECLLPIFVSGALYEDLDGNGQKDAGEPALAGWTVDLLDQTSTVVATAMSDATGAYHFDNLVAQAYTVQAVPPAGWIITQPAGPSSYALAANSGSTNTGRDFGNFHTISVSGTVYDDLDGNGLRNGGESGVQGLTVDLLGAGNQVVDSQQTDASGLFTFTGVGPGSFSVAQVVPSGVVQTQPQFPTAYSFTAQSGHNFVALNFGDHAAAALTPTVVIDNGQAGYSETGTWSTVVGGLNGTNRVARTVHVAPATATATWDFTALNAATYDVYVTFSGKSIYSTAAPFTVRDGATSLGTQSIDESILVTQAQGGRAQGSYGGVGWLQLGSFAISSGELVVTLNNNAANNFVDADGVLIVAH